MNSFNLQFSGKHEDSLKLFERLQEQVPDVVVHSHTNYYSPSVSCSTIDRIVSEILREMHVESLLTSKKASSSSAAAAATEKDTKSQNSKCIQPFDPKKMPTDLLQMIFEFIIPSVRKPIAWKLYNDALTRTSRLFHNISQENSLWVKVAEHDGMKLSPEEQKDAKAQVIKYTNKTRQKRDYLSEIHLGYNNDIIPRILQCLPWASLASCAVVSKKLNRQVQKLYKSSYRVRIELNSSLFSACFFSLFQQETDS